MKKILLLALFALMANFTFQSCGKPKDTVAIVTVVDVNGAPVAGALVHLIGYDSMGNEGGRIDVEATTDASGKATFNFNDLYKRGSAGFAVLEIEASKAAMLGDGIIKVEEEKTNEATVTIQ